MIYAFIIITFILLIIVEIFTVLLRMTGLSEARSRFQVISMLTGVGYTTKESESIVANRLRRNIAQIIIILGYTSSVTLISIFVNLYTHKISIKGTITVVIYCILMLLLERIKFIKIAFDNLIELIANHYLNKNERNKLHTLNHYNDNILAELTILNDIPILDKPLSELNLKTHYGVQILNIESNGVSISHPLGTNSIHLKDKILVFGSSDNIRKIFKTF